MWPRTGRGKEFLPFFSFFIFPYPHTLTFLMNPFLNLLLQDHTIATLFIMLTYKSADEILWCYLSNKTSWTELSHSNVYFTRFDNIKQKFDFVCDFVLWSLSAIKKLSEKCAIYLLTRGNKL